MRNIEYDKEEKRAENVTLHSKRHTQASGDDTQRSPEQRVTDAGQRAHKSGLYAVDGGFVKILFVSVCLFHRCRNAQN